MLALALVCFALVALLAYREWGTARERAQVAADRAAEREEAAEERRRLYQRIQAPQTAVADDHRERRGPYVRREPIGADDDAAFTARQAERQAKRDAEEAMSG